MMEIEIPFIAELKRAFAIFNKHLFGKKLNDVEFVIQPKKKVSLRWVAENETIVIGMDFIKLEFDEILGVLLHEMIHVANHQDGVIDVTANQYHNKYFLQGALNVGLVVIKHKTQGWAITGTVFPRNVVEWVYIRRPEKNRVKIRVITFDSIEFNRTEYKALQAEVRQQIKLEKPIKNYFLKYQCNCPPPHNSIRSGRRPDGRNVLNALCQDCRSLYECVTDLESNKEN